MVESLESYPRQRIPKKMKCAPILAQRVATKLLGDRAPSRVAVGALAGRLFAFIFPGINLRSVCNRTRSEDRSSTP
jgi:hypothetical protein